VALHRKARRQGRVLAMQYPVEIPGVTHQDLPQTRKFPAPGAGAKVISTRWACSAGARKAKTLTSGRDAEPPDVGFSGGEKKRWRSADGDLRAQVAILDETDSDWTSMPEAGGGRGERAARSFARHAGDHPLPAPAGYIGPTAFMSWPRARIVAEGGKELALELEAKGYEHIVKEPA